MRRIRSRVECEQDRALKLLKTRHCGRQPGRRGALALGL
jgi:hypothetical protein